MSRRHNRSAEKPASDVASITSGASAASSTCWSSCPSVAISRCGCAWTTPSFSASNPTRLFDAPSAVFDGRFIGVGTVRNYDVAPDGRRFLIIKQNGAAGDRLDSATRMIVVQNWFEELKRRAPSNVN